MKAIELLELLQKDAYRHKGVNPETVREDEVQFALNFITNKQCFPSEKKNREIRTLAIEEIKRSLLELPTKYQGIKEYLLLKIIFCNLETVIKNVYIDSPTKKDWDHLELSEFEQSLYESDNEILEESESVATKKDSLSWKPLPLFGSLDYGNGFTAYVVQSDEPLIVVSNEMFNLASVMSSIISECYPYVIDKGKKIFLSTNKDDWFAWLSNDKNNMITRRFCDLMFTLLLRQPPGVVKIDGVYQYDTYQGIISHHFTNIIETFFVSHEYCHYLLNHPPYKISSIEQLTSLDADRLKLGLKEMLSNYAYEYEADLYGSIITFASRILDKRCKLDLRFTIAALYTSLWILEMLDRTTNISEGKPSREERFGVTHPCPNNRMLSFKKNLIGSNIIYNAYGIADAEENNAKVKKYKGEIDEIIKCQIDNIDFVFEFLFGKFESFLTDILMLNQGITIRDIMEMEYSMIQDKIYEIRK